MWVGRGTLNLLRRQNLILATLRCEENGRIFKQGSDVVVPVLQENHQASQIEERFKVCRQGARWSALQGRIPSFYSEFVPNACIVASMMSGMEKLNKSFNCKAFPDLCL